MLSDLAAGGMGRPEDHTPEDDGMVLPERDLAASEAAGTMPAPAEEPAPPDEEAGVPDVVAEPVNEPPAVLSPVAALRRQLEAAPDDPEVRVALAAALAEAGCLDEALPIYDGLATPASGYLERVLTELEAIAKANPEHRPLRELMGDAYARAGRFRDAMAMYRWLLAQDDADSVLGG